mmetsp:Transcript_121772/g.339686  ORF Transcript_121772/g.339686 Transcript_121772/m.339686 type:complete len:120 (+) Transcript_121772:64-423(+)
MAAPMRSRSVFAPTIALAALAAAALWASTPSVFVPVSAGPASAAASAATALMPIAAHASPAVEAIDMPVDVMNVGSSFTLAGLTEVLMCGIVMGVVPTTILGLMVAAWLQFKKGPTLGL